MEYVSWIVIAGCVSGCLYLTTPRLAIWLQHHRLGLFWIIAVGLLFRFALMIPEPFFEIDFYRYFWDGAVINAGFSPYVWSPEDILSGEAPTELQHLAAQMPGLLERINYPHLTTIYPPVTEASFALTSWLKPWSLTVWRFVILSLDLITLGLIIHLLRFLNRPPIWVIVYWWNPIVIVEFSNAAHMDVLLLPFLILAVLFSLKHRPIAGATLLAFATAIKLWPVILFPTIIRTIVARPALLATCTLVFTILTATLLWPFLEQTMRPDAGVMAYSTSWVRNAALFQTVQEGIRWALDQTGSFDLDADQITRAMVAIAMSSIALGINWRQPDNAEDLIQRVIIVIAALLLLGPTLYPWYYTWIVPFLCVVPSRPLMAFSIVLPLYRLQFHSWFLEHPHVFGSFIVWWEQGPILALLVLAWWQNRAMKRS